MRFEKKERVVYNGSEGIIVGVSSGYCCPDYYDILLRNGGLVEGVREDSEFLSIPDSLYKCGDKVIYLNREFKVTRVCHPRCEYHLVRIHNKTLECYKDVKEIEIRGS